MRDEMDLDAILSAFNEEEQPPAEEPAAEIEAQQEQEPEWSFGEPEPAEEEPIEEEPAEEPLEEEPAEEPVYEEPIAEREAPRRSGRREEPRYTGEEEESRRSLTRRIGMGMLRRVDRWAQDWLFQHPGVPLSDIVIIGIDEEALELFGPYNTWDRNIMASANSSSTRAKASSSMASLILFAASPATRID